MFLHPSTSIALFAIGAFSFQFAAYSDEYAGKLKALTPDYAAPPLDVLEEPGDDRFVVTLVGVSLEQDGERLSGEIPLIASNGTLKVTTYWRAGVRMQSRVSAQLSFWDHLGVFREPIALRVGPASDAPAWEVGGVYLTSHDIDMRPIARKFSGRASMSFALLGAANRMYPRQLLHIAVAPLVRTSSVLNLDIEAAFGEGSRFIAKHFRLGKEARTVLPVPEAWRAGNRRLAIVSNITYETVEQGVPVCNIVLNPGKDSETRLLLVVGEGTALDSFDARRTESADHEKARIFASRDSGQVNPQGTPIQLHTYLEIYDLPPDIERIDSIAFECDSAVLLNIDGVALLP
jgi:hypothetical protein